MRYVLKFYGVFLLLMFIIILSVASTLGVAVLSVVLCCVYKTGWWALLLIIELFSIPAVISFIVGVNEG